MRERIDWLYRLMAPVLPWCAHTNTTFPQTPRHTRRTYVCCVECGAEFAYDWIHAKRGSRLQNVGAR